ncbi:MAG TPA: protoporphyrinogen oxidase [Micromonosporaceae bacterium]|jgi:oxygen-dependent protoporphyrinogen oxidase|nr:protoporphyrinogen oxidase [Micromonosporaceae bacterium]
MRNPIRIAVVGGGIAGLAAALRLRDQAPEGARITVYEQSAAVGGKLRTGALAGSTVELGAEAFLVGDGTGVGESPAVALARRVGLADALVHPEPVGAAIAVDGTLRAIPGGTLLGVPGNLDLVAPLARPAAERDRDGGRPVLGPDEDVAVGELVRRRLGDEVVDRLVDPILGGVYAGRADRLSLVATAPGLAAACRAEHTLTGAVRAALAAAPRPPGTPVFATVAGGVSRLVEAVVAAAGAQVRLGLPVRELASRGAGWRLAVGSRRDPREEEADAVVLAVPARPAARLLVATDPDAAADVGVLDYASVALVTLALPGAALPELSGFLIPASEGTAVKAATFFDRKWAHLRRDDGVTLVRASVGRHGEEAVLRSTDGDLATTVHGELSRLVGPLPAPVDAVVQRWGGALPQYAPGHVDRVRRVRAVLRAGHPRLALAGAAYDGVGIAACVRSGEAAAEEIIKALGESFV